MMQFSSINLMSYLLSPWAWVAALWGAFIGSFLNVCIFRIPEQTFFAKVRSCCRSCGSEIPFYHNVPILSYVVLRGRANCCGAKISYQYPLVELATAALFFGVYTKFPFISGQGSGFEFHPATLLRALHAAVFLSLLLVCSVIDFRLMIIPDVISLPMIVVSPLVAWLHPDLTLKSSAFGIVVGFGVFYLIAWVYLLVRREYGLGMGDVKLLGAIGGWLGVQAILPTILYGSIVGSIVGILAILVSRQVGLRTALPFGPFLALGAATQLFWTDLLPDLLSL